MSAKECEHFVYNCERVRSDKSNNIAICGASKRSIPLSCGHYLNGATKLPKRAVKAARD